jgi:PPOX class probable F420-dependent enzyme
VAVPRWLIDSQYWVMDKGRSRKAAKAAQQGATAQGFDAVRGARQGLVVTYKRSGEPVPTPVNIGMSDDGKVYFRAEPTAWKVRRITNNPRVLVGPCTLRGKPKGPLAEGTARILTGDDVARGESEVAGGWSAPMRALEKSLDAMKIPVVYVEITPGPAVDAPAGSKDHRQ